MYERKILPFYMTYPLPLYYQEEDTILKDLEYLQQMYPADARKYQKKIAEILDKLDYEGSMMNFQTDGSCISSHPISLTGSEERKKKMKAKSRLHQKNGNGQVI